MSTLSATSDAAAGAQFQSVVQATGLVINRLSELAQLQLAVAELYVNAPPGSIAAADIASGTFGANIPDTGAYLFPASVTVATNVNVTNGILTVSRVSSVLARFRRDDANLLELSVLSTGAVTWTATGSAASHTFPNAVQLGAAAGTDLVTIGGGAYGAGVASLRLNGLTSAAGAQTGTLTNAPVAGNPAAWIPINIAGTVRAFPVWALA